MSRFISGGTDEQPTERDAAWLKAQQEIEAKHLQTLAAAQQQDSGRSLFDTLQANKGRDDAPLAAKQDAFDAKAKLSNQFQNLNEDEVAFLDEVLASTREKERSVRQETSQQLLAFRRRQQEEAEKVVRVEELQDAPTTATAAEGSWAVGPRKRKKGREREGMAGLIKVRRTSEDVAPPSVERGSSSAATAATLSPPSPSSPSPVAQKPGVSPATTVMPITASTAVVSALKPVQSKLGIIAYSSDEDEGE